MGIISSKDRTLSTMVVARRLPPRCGSRNPLCLMPRLTYRSRAEMAAAKSSIASVPPQIISPVMLAMASLGDDSK